MPARLFGLSKEIRGAQNNAPKNKECFLACPQAAQASVEYLILLAAFFAVLGLILPVISSSVQGLLFSSDVLLAKKIAGDLQEKASLFAFLADGSRVSLEYIPAKGVFVYSRGTKIICEAGGKRFEAETGSQQLVVKEPLAKKFKIIVEKKLGSVQVFVEQG